MARIHVHRRGKSGSSRPARTQHPKWSPLGPKEIDTQVNQLAREGKSTALIGAYMRDQFGVPSVKTATGKRIEQILKANNLQPRLPEDLTNLLKRIVNLQDHLARTKKDHQNERAPVLLESKVRRLAKYYVRVGRLPADWKYSGKTVKLLLQ